MKLIRVFPRQTNATPDDDNVRIGLPYMWDEADEVHISVAFDNDKEIAEKLAIEWQYVTSNIKVGGPAYGDPGGEFTPGMYVKHGYTITSRGCPNKCWFCRAWRIEGNNIRTLDIKPGWNILDNNLLACPDQHVKAVFEMLKQQKKRPQFTGGFEAALLQDWHVNELVQLKPKVMWFAYDTPDDFEPLVNASKLLRNGGIITKTKHVACCYVLIGWNKDTFSAAEKRLKDVVKLGYFPQAMLFNEGIHFTSETERKQWKNFAREWANKIIVGSKFKELFA